MANPHHNQHTGDASCLCNIEWRIDAHSANSIIDLAAVADANPSTEYTQMFTEGGFYILCLDEHPFGPCTMHCSQPRGHEGQHRAQCITWCNPHNIRTDIANLWSGPKDLWNTADGGQIIGQMVTRYCHACPWMEEHMCAFGEDGDCDHTEGWAEK